MPRLEYLTADIGITGCNFAVAETGSKWYRKDLHVMVENHFNIYFHSEMVRVSKQEAFPK